jgi:hypothetical protein
MGSAQYDDDDKNRRNSNDRRNSNNNNNNNNNNNTNNNNRVPTAPTDTTTPLGWEVTQDRRGSRPLDEAW